MKKDLDVIKLSMFPNEGFEVSDDGKIYLNGLCVFLEESDEEIKIILNLPKGVKSNSYTTYIKVNEIGKEKFSKKLNKSSGKFIYTIEADITDYELVIVDLDMVTLNSELLIRKTITSESDRYGYEFRYINVNCKDCDRDRIFVVPETYYGNRRINLFYEDDKGTLSSISIYERDKNNKGLKHADELDKLNIIMDYIFKTERNIENIKYNKIFDYIDFIFDLYNTRSPKSRIKEGRDQVYGRLGYVNYREVGVVDESNTSNSKFVDIIIPTSNLILKIMSPKEWNNFSISSKEDMIAVIYKELEISLLDVKERLKELIYFVESNRYINKDYLKLFNFEDILDNMNYSSKEYTVIEQLENIIYDIDDLVYSNK